MHSGAPPNPKPTGDNVNFLLTPLTSLRFSPGWLYREPRGGGARPWLPPRRAWFVLTRDSLDQFSNSGKGARRLGSLVLTSLCSVTGPERRPKETGEPWRGLAFLPGQWPQPALITFHGLFPPRFVVSDRVWPEA